jgi:outer membrane murein-binding lipoprotein Lpp
MRGMGRPAVINQDKIREAIKELEAEKKEVNAITIRERLGSGSYSTIAAVLAAWRREQAAAVRPIIPEMPETLTHILRHLWAEAWKAADSAHESERQAREREEIEHKRLQAEMGQEITRLEAELARVESERESARAASTKAEEELARERVERAKAESTVGTLQAEMTKLRAESHKALETVTAWVERASRAEARLEELAKGAGERRS